MPNNSPLSDQPATLLAGPELALVLYLLLALYGLALLAATSSATLPGLGWLNRRTIYRDLSIGLGLLATVPAIALALVLTSRAADQREERAMALLNEITASVAGSVQQFLEKHETGMASLATSIGRAGRMDAKSLTEWLESHHFLYADYLTLLAANTAGDIVTATTMVQGQPERIAELNHNIGDRSYFIVPMRDGGVFRSDVFKGRGFGEDPIIAISAVVKARDGSNWGIVEGSVNLQQLSRFRPPNSTFGQDANLLILDQQDRVVFSSNPYSNSMLELVDVNRAREQNARQLVAYAELKAGWQILMSISRAPIHSLVWSDARISLLWLLATILVAMMLSAAIARRVTRPLRALSQAVRAMDLGGAKAEISPLPGAPAEIREMFVYLRSMSERLQNSYLQLTAAMEAGKHYREQLETTLSRRETEIKSRTKELEYSNRNLRTLSNVDQLTGLPNRRRFDEALEQGWRHCMRKQVPISIVLIDVDHFKAFNDTYGHQAGDRCLAQIGGALSACVWRPLDLVARYGGEEFIMILSDTELSSALAVAERTRRAIADLRVPHAGSPMSVITLSLGAAATVPERDSGYDPLIQLADRALYYAKERGRDTVAYAENHKTAVYDDSIESTLCADTGDRAILISAEDD